jgi:hypothetical protein
VPFGEQLSAIATLLEDESSSGILSTVFETISIVAAVQVCEDVVDYLPQSVHENLELPSVC